MQDKSRVWGFFAHASIIVGMIFIVFFVIDRFNPAMEFLTSNLSKWLIFLLRSAHCLQGSIPLCFCFKSRNGAMRSAAIRRFGRPMKRRALTGAFAQPYYDPRGYPQQRQLNGSAPAQTTATA
jgi:hypothetical protein